MTKNNVTHPVPGWSRAMGWTAVERATPRPTGDETLDRILIEERLHRYAWGYDERDLAGLGDCFTENGVWEGWTQGTDHAGPYEGRAAIEKYMSDFFERQSEQRRHIFSNVIIDDYAGGSATVHAYLLLMSSTRGESTVVTAGPYRLDVVKCHDGIWRISHLRGGWDSPSPDRRSTD